jgi:hypothetical protein
MWNRHCDLAASRDFLMDGVLTTAPYRYALLYHYFTSLASFGA